MGATFDKLLGRVLFHKHKLEDISDYSSSAATTLKESFTADGTETTFTVTTFTATDNTLVFVDGIYMDSGVTRSGNDFIFDSAPFNGSKITISGGLIGGTTNTKGLSIEVELLGTGNQVINHSLTVVPNIIQAYDSVTGADVSLNVTGRDATTITVNHLVNQTVKLNLISF